MTAREQRRNATMQLTISTSFGFCRQIQQYIKGLSFPSKFLVLNELVEHKRIHLGPDSSMACTSNEESLVRSEYRSDDERSYDLYLLDSTL